MNWRIWLGTAVGAGLTGAALRLHGFSLWLAVGAAFAWYGVQWLLDEILVLGPQRREFILRTLAERGEQTDRDLVRGSDGLLTNVHLNRAERAGLIASRPAEPEYEEHRRMYRLTEKGRAALEVEEEKR